MPTSRSTANPYPGFTGEPGYPVDVEIPRPSGSPAGRSPSTAARDPGPVLAAAVGAGSAVRLGGASRATRRRRRRPSTPGSEASSAACAFLGWFAALVLGRMPKGLRDLAAYGVGYSAQAWAYPLLLTDRYPNSDPEAIGPTGALPPHPVQLQLNDDGRRSRLTVFFRLLLALPHLVWLALWSVAAVLAAIVNWLVALVRGRSAEPLHRFLAAYVRYSVHVTAFATLIANPFPGFAGAPGYPVDVTIAPPDRQNRWITFFRDVPRAAGVPPLERTLGRRSSAAPSSAGSRRSPPAGCRPACATSERCRSATSAQTNAYWFVLDRRYPYASPALRPPAEPESGAGARAGVVRGSDLSTRSPALRARPRCSSSPGSGRPPRGRSGTASCRRPLTLPTSRLAGDPAGDPRPRRALRDASSGSSSSSPSSS